MDWEGDWRPEPPLAGDAAAGGKKEEGRKGGGGGDEDNGSGAVFPLSWRGEATGVVDLLRHASKTLHVRCQIRERCEK